MNNNTEISDLIVKAYAYQKNGELSMAIQVWNELIKKEGQTIRGMFCY